jgi:nitrous oxidase accessory protein NosD
MLLFAQARAVVRACVLMCLAMAAPAVARTTFVTQGSIAGALNVAAPGDTIILLPGGYGVVALPRKSWQTPINIDARAATMSGVVFFKTGGVNWTGGTIIGTGYGVSISNSERISVSATDVSGGTRGIVINNSTDVKVLRNKLHGLRTDGVDIVGQRILVEGNQIWDMSPAPADHPDGIQMWNATGSQTRDVTIRGNIITGAMQGIFGRSTGVPLSNIVVTGNRVTVDYPNGIVVTNTEDSIITGNVVRSQGSFKVNLRVDGANLMACGNTVPDVPKAYGAQSCAG